MRGWFPIIVPPLVVLAVQSANYALVALECHTQQRFPVHVASGAALLVSIAGIALAWSQWRAAAHAGAGESGDAGSQTRLLAIVGISLSGLSLLTIATQWLTTAFVSPCVH